MGITTSHVVPYPREQVWEWHTRPGAVVRLTPPFVPLSLTRETASLARGTTEFSLPAGLTWSATHDLSGYHEGRRFTDVCTNAPMRAFSSWRHTHQFDDHPEGTLITDTVSTRLPGSFLKAIFAYRQHQLIEDLRRVEEYAELQPRPLIFAVTGSSGLIGTHLVAQLRTAGHTVIRLVRHEPQADDERLWHTTMPDEGLVDDVDVLIHLAGESIIGRMSESHRTKIRQSRIIPTRRLAELVAASPTCRTMVCASAVGYYGPDQRNTLLTEDSPRGEGFLADVCAEWEAACEPAREAGARVVNIRTGVVLSNAGGLLPIFRVAFKVGLAPQLGTDGGYIPWISLDDLTSLYIRSSLDERISGAINATAPHPARAEEFSNALKHSLNRTFTVPIPHVAPRLALGTIASEELLFTSQNVVPSAMASLDYRFTHADLTDALAHELGGEQCFDVAPAD